MTTAKDINRDRRSPYASQNRNESHGIRNEIKEVANRAGQTVYDFYSRGKQEATEVVETCASAIRSKPVKSSLIALGAGFIIGNLLRRR